MMKFLKKTCIALISTSILFISISNAKDEKFSAVENNLLKRLVPYSEDSIAEGKKIFSLNCTSCHGSDGKARIDFVSDATDLTDPTRWRNGTSELNIYQSLTEGAGVDMPPFKYSFTDEKEFWHLINWITSNWTIEQRKTLLKPSS